MKKLALALMCMVSVAFFASCTQPKGQPTIAVLSEEGYVKDGDVVNLGDTVNYGFVMAVSPESNSLLKTLIVKIDDEAPDTITIQGTEHTWRGSIVYNLNTRDEIVGESLITATVTDAAGETATTSIKLSLNQPAVALETKDFSWVRQGSSDATGLAEYGLEWTGNGKEVFAIIKPVAGAEMYLILPEDWAAVKTDVDKAAFFSDGVYSVISDFRGVSAWNSKDYDYVIGTLYNGEYHMIHITHGEVQTITNSQGQTIRTDITITGQSK